MNYSNELDTIAYSILDQRGIYWYEHCKSYINSSYSVQQYCDNNELSIWTFRKWLCKNLPKKGIKLEKVILKPDKSATKIKHELDDLAYDTLTERAIYWYEHCKEYINRDIGMYKYCHEKEINYESMRKWLNKILPEKGIRLRKKLYSETVIPLTYDHDLDNKAKECLTLKGMFWYSHCKNYIDSDMSISKYCLEQQINEGTFITWFYRKLPYRGINLRDHIIIDEHQMSPMSQWQIILKGSSN